MFTYTQIKNQMLEQGYYIDLKNTETKRHPSPGTPESIVLGCTEARPSHAW